MRQRLVAADFRPQKVYEWKRKSRTGWQQKPIRLTFVPFGTSNHLGRIHLTLKREATRSRAYGTDNGYPIGQFTGISGEDPILDTLLRGLQNNDGLIGEMIDLNADQLVQCFAERRSHCHVLRQHLFYQGT